ncbi:HNH endonuclease [Microbacterium sp. NPDC058021]|uniref:HNH endonuclease n=1 Tax=Microbacterium sp. NPDC058021 TaxID=3346306 RepID=UPI0036DF25BC
MRLSRTPMWRIDRPAITVHDVATQCAAGVRDSAFARRIRSSRANLTANSLRLSAAHDSDRLHDLDPDHFEVSDLTDAEMKKIYKTQLARSGRPARSSYDELISGALRNLCTYCQYGVANTLDHFVPKDVVAGLAIEPLNLIPACSRCNHVLGSSVADGYDDQFLYPYGAPSLGRWLWAELLETEPVSVRFVARPHPGLAPTVQSRVTFQFRQLKLGQLFAVVSATDLAEMRETLTANFSDGCADDVRGHLRDTARILFGVDENNRRAVLFEALADNDWYCEGGYSSL